MTRRSYTVHIRADTDVISVSIPENVTSDVSGNGNGASNTLQVRHCKDSIFSFITNSFFVHIHQFFSPYSFASLIALSSDSAPVESLVLSYFATAAFGVTALVAGLLTVSTASLLSAGAFSKPSAIPRFDPARNLFVISHHLIILSIDGLSVITKVKNNRLIAQTDAWERKLLFIFFIKYCEDLYQFHVIVKFPNSKNLNLCDLQLQLYSFFYLVQRVASHLQVFALSKWLAVTLPVEYYELARGLQWSIPYFKLPWETGDLHSVMVGSTSSKDRLLRIPKEHNSIFFEGLQPEAANTDSAAKVFGLPLSPMEYASYFEV